MKLYILQHTFIDNDQPFIAKGERYIIATHWSANHDQEFETCLELYKSQKFIKKKFVTNTTISQFENVKTLITCI